MMSPQSCKRLRAAMHALVPFWLQQCQKQGWRVTDEYASKRKPNWLHAILKSCLLPFGTSLLLISSLTIRTVLNRRATQSGTVFNYYSRRMLMRWQVRCFEPWDHVAYLYVQMLNHCSSCRSAFKQVIPFLDYASQAALLIGTCKLLLTPPV